MWTNIMAVSKDGTGHHHKRNTSDRETPIACSRIPTVYIVEQLAGLIVLDLERSLSAGASGSYRVT